MVEGFEAEDVSSVRVPSLATIEQYREDASLVDGNFCFICNAAGLPYAVP